MGSKPFSICSDVRSILPALVNFHPQRDEQGEGDNPLAKEPLRLAYLP